MTVKIISIDFQKEFTTPEGQWYNPGRSVGFIKDTLIPFWRAHDIKIFEIISDYRQPRPGDAGDGCYPGSPGYESEIPAEVKSGDTWIKCMNSPIWIRENIGIANTQPGLPYQDPGLFTEWLEQTIGRPGEVEVVILIGLTVDRCVFCVAQELRWRGYNVKVLEEGTDAVGGNLETKAQILTDSPLLNWAGVIKWDDLKGLLTETSA